MARPAVSSLIVTLLLAAAATAARAAERTPPRLLVRPDQFDECQVQGVGGLGKYAEVNATLQIGKDGAPGKFDLVEGTPAWASSLTRCVLAKLQFSPGTRDGEGAASSASLAIRFRERESEPGAGIVVDGIGAFVTPPWYTRKPGDYGRCYPRKFRDVGQTARFVVTVTIQPDGAISDLQLPVGSGPEHENAARCLLEDVQFSPGTRDGQPVVTEAAIPFLLYFDDTGEMVMPQPDSTPADLEAAYQACISRELVSMGSAFYQFDISTRGKVSRPKLVKTSGDPRLDEAGLCIVRMLKFTPMRQGGQAVPSTITWELPMRPPR